MCSRMRLAAVAAAWLTLVACGGAQHPTAPKARSHPKATASAVPRALRGPPGLPGAIIAELAATETEVLFARRGSQGMMVALNHGRWLAGGVRLGAAVAAGRLRVSVDEQLQDVGPAPPGAVHSLGRAGRGFALVWAGSDDSGAALWAEQFDAAGHATGGPKRVFGSPIPLRWAEVLDGPGGAFVAWETGADDNRQVGLVPLATEANHTAQAIATRASGWHAVASAAGAAVAWVTNEGGARGRVRLVMVGRRGERGPIIELNHQPTAQADVQLAALADGYLAAWTDAADDDPHVVVTRVDSRGAIAQAAGPAVPPVGAQALVALVGATAGDGALIAFEQQGGGGAARHIALRLLDAQAALRPPRAELALPAGLDLPRFVADRSGYAMLALAPAVLGNQAVDGAPILPTAIRLGPGLDVRASEPVRSEQLARRTGSPAGNPAIVRGLDCQGDRCTLVALSAGPSPVMALLGLPARRSRWQSPARLLPRAAPPEPASLTTVAESEQPIDELAATRLADGRTLLAWLTHDGAAALAPADPGGATLGYRFISPAGAPGPARVLSRHAIAPGGVALAASAAAQGHRGRGAPVAVLAWVAPNSGSPQVFVSSIAADGKRLQQKVVTKIQRRRGARVGSEVFDVNIAAEPDGSYLCAWSDTRDGDAEIYLARVSATLDKSKPDRRITHASGESTGAALAIAGPRALLAWSDARDGVPAADIFLAAIDRRTLEPVGKPRRLERTAAHSRTPRLVRGSGGETMLAWIEEAEPANAAPGASHTGSLRLVAVGDRGESRTAVRRVSLASARAVTSAALGCGGGRCRGVLLGQGDGSLVVGAMNTSAESGAPLRARPLLRLAGGSLQDASLVAPERSLVELYFAEDTSSGSRVRRLGLRW